MIVKVRANAPATDDKQIRLLSVEDRRQQICMMIPAVPQLDNAMAGDQTAYFSATYLAEENRLEIRDRVCDRKW